jgi:hypothetical protein
VDNLQRTSGSTEFYFMERLLCITAIYKIYRRKSSINKLSAVLAASRRLIFQMLINPHS